MEVFFFAIMVLAKRNVYICSMQTILGIMSGTSLDGVDIAACQFWQENAQWKYAILAAHTYPYSKHWQEKLQHAVHLFGLELSLLHNELGRLFAQYVNQFCHENNITAQLIASHGHTIFHQPEKQFTLQIGSGAEIAAHTGIDVINNFRVLDVALHGQGAPLVPIGDELLFSQYDACINLGGFANISSNRNGKRVAWDICPVNIVLNSLAQALDLEYDKDGALARSGQIIPELLSYLNYLEFYRTTAPKSLGREWVETHIFDYLQKKNEPTQDLLHTFTQHCAHQITEEIRMLHAKNVLFTGGGTLNAFLIELIKEKSNCEIIVPEPQLIHFKEALIFAFLGHLRSLNKINTLKEVTGAHHNSIGGAWWKGK